MNNYYYDLHIHSCLSPCGDDDSTPNNIAGMGELNGLNIMALTDHNTCKNCPAFFVAAKKHGIIPVPGMELTTAEDIHVICLFSSIDSAMAFDKEIDSRRVKVKNRIDIFGNQFIMDYNDEIIGTDEFLLSNATTVMLEEVPQIVNKYNGICYPAHINRSSNGIIAVLGAFPENPHFSCAELSDPTEIKKYSLLSGIPEDKIVISSDAHYLWNIKDKNEHFLLDDEPYSSDLVRNKLLDYLGRKL